MNSDDDDFSFVTPTTVAVGGKNKMKIAATFAAFKRLDTDNGFHVIQGTDAGSAVSEQPVGLEETLAGAQFRAAESLRLEPKAQVGVGIENGLIPIGGSMLDRLTLAIMVRTNWN